MAKQYILYGHGGSLNHGGEALARTTINLVRCLSPESKVILSTHFADQDRRVKLEADEFVERDCSGNTNEIVYAPTIEKITPDSVCVHLGGDNYCYRNWQRYAAIHYAALNRGATSILWSCSINPEAINQEMLQCLRTHHLITARENITYHTLVQYGLSNVLKVSDIAFTLKPVPVEFPLQNFVAVNLSPLEVRKNPLTQAAVEKLIDYVIMKTDMAVALIPHVLAPMDNDYELLAQIKKKYKERVTLISDQMSAGQYKYIISKARFGVFARTHAAIAGYSTLVPTLAIGYSIKAKGIASDLGLYDYVIDVGKLSKEDEILSVFCKLVHYEKLLRNTLAEQMPQYIENAVNKKALEYFM